MSEPKRTTAPGLIEKKRRGERIAMVTAYDYPSARLADQAEVDAILVGDTLGMVVLGYSTTLPVTLDDMLHHVRAVARAETMALVIADMPFLSFQISPEEALRNAGRLLQEGGAAAVARAVAEAGAGRDRRARPSRCDLCHRCHRCRRPRWPRSAPAGAALRATTWQP